MCKPSVLRRKYKCSTHMMDLARVMVKERGGELVTGVDELQNKIPDKGKQTKEGILAWRSVKPNLNLESKPTSKLLVLQEDWALRV